MPRAIEATSAKRSRRDPALVAALVALALGLWNLPFSSFMAGDFIQLGMLEHVFPVTWLGPFSLYTLSDGDPQRIQTLKDVGALPWFFEPGFKMAFFRPLSSATLALDHALFGLNPIGYQAHVALWFLVLVVGVAKLYGLVLRCDTSTDERGAAPGGSIATLALVLFTVAGAHGMLCWTATRHIAIAAALGIFALYSHVRWREEHWGPGRVLSVAGFAASLSAGEAALGVIAYFFAYEAVAGPGARRERLSASLPVGCIVAAYLAMYQLLGYGASAGSDYLDPFHDPLRYITEIPGRLVFLIGAMLMGGNADLWIIRPDFRPALILAAIVVTGLGGIMLGKTWTTLSTAEQRVTRWLFAGTFMAALPFAGSPIGARCLIVPWIGGAVLIALVLRYWWTTLRWQPGFSNRLLSALGWGLAIIHLILAPIQRLAGPPLLRQILFQDVAQAVGEPRLGGEQLAGRTLVIMNADGRIGGHGYFFRRLYRLPMPAAWRALSWAPGAHRLRRTAADTLTLELVDGELHAPYLVSGEVIDVAGMRATVTQMGRDGPTAVTFRFDRSLDDPNFVLLMWKDGRLQSVAPPAVGETLELPAAI